MEPVASLSAAAPFTTTTGAPGKVVTIKKPLVPDEETASVETKAKRQRMLEILQERKNANRIILKTSETRHIVFLGRTRSGKSTALATLRSPFTFAKDIELFSQTKHPQLHAFTIEHIAESDQEENRNYNINIIDTPGLFERGVAGSQVRTDEQLKELISKCLELEITRLHSLFFVCSFSSGINAEDLEAIAQLNELFAGGDKVFNLLITRCEDKSASQRAQIEAQVRSIPELHAFFSNPRVKIFFIGALDHGDFDMGAYDSVESKLNNILVLRTALYNHIFESDDSVHMRELELYKKQHRTVDDLMNDVEKLTHVCATSPTPEDKIQLNVVTEQLETAVKVMTSILEDDQLRRMYNLLRQAHAALL